MSTEVAIPRQKKPNDHTTDSFADLLASDLEWCADIVLMRLKLYLGQECVYQDITHLPPALPEGTSPYAEFLKQHSLNFEERLLLVLSLVPHLRPQLLDFFLVKNTSYDREFTEFGGVLEAPHKGFLPTGETALFLLAGKDIHKRLACGYLFGQNHLFATKNILSLTHTNTRAPYFSGLLQLNERYLDRFTGLPRPAHHYHVDFPAHPISTALNWEDLVLPAHTKEEVMEILTWMEHGETLLHAWELRTRIKPGCRVIFHGPPGTGKTLTATLLGKTTGKEVYRIDLDKITSKYIGETEKNLARVFDEAGNKDWILFFDEADALFGKRTQVNNANDRHANQEVAYLLQRIEDFPGVVVLASNLLGNLDKAFTRRFQAIIQFPMPGPEERRLLWEKSFSKHCTLSEDIDLARVAEAYALAGGALINVVRYCSLEALKRHSSKILLADLEKGIRRELMKEGRTS